MRLLAALVLSLAVFVPPAAAAPKYDPEARAATIAPFIDDQVLGVAWVDLSRIDVDAIATRLAEAAKVEPKDFVRPKEMMGDLVEALKKAGAREVYFVLSLADLLPNPSFAVLPLDKEADRRAVAEAFGKLPGYEASKSVDGFLVVGSKQTVLRMESRKPVKRPELAKAFAATGDTAAQVVLLLNDDLRRALEEVMPTLPKELGGTAIKAATRGLQWAALGVDAAPKMALRLVIQTPDAEAARELSRLIVKAYKALGEDKQVRDYLPDFPKLSDLLTPQVEDNRLVLNLGDKDMMAVLLPFAMQFRGAAGRTDATNSLKQLGLALHNYHDTHGRFPPPAALDKKRKPLLSWRVYVLPFIEQEPLFKQFKLDEPWDSEHNKKLIARMPAVFRTRNVKHNEEGKTTYLVPVGKTTIFPPGPQGIRVVEIADGTSNTIMLVDADDEHAVIWTKPDDYAVDAKTTGKGLHDYPPSGFLVCLADGSVRFIPKNIDAMTIQALFTRSGGEVINLP